MAQSIHTFVICIHIKTCLCPHTQTHLVQEVGKEGQEGLGTYVFRGGKRKIGGSEEGKEGRREGLKEGRSEGRKEERREGGKEGRRKGGKE